MIDFEEEIMDYQKSFVSTIGKIREKNMMTFPVLTCSLLKVDGKFVDEEFARHMCRMNQIWNDFNFYISEDVTSLSNCCINLQPYRVICIVHSIVNCWKGLL